MHFAIITRNLPGENCGLADHSFFFGESLRNFGHRVTLIGAKGRGDGQTVLVEDDWSPEGLVRLGERLEFLNPDQVVLQFTPLHYSQGHRLAYGLMDFWRSCSARWRTSLIVHETYAWDWGRPLGWLGARAQKRLTRRLIEESFRAFSASGVLVEELGRSGYADKAVYLPIGSNFPKPSGDRDTARGQCGIGKEEIVLVIFGAAGALKGMERVVERADRELRRKDLKIRWLILGRVPRAFFRLDSPAVSPGWLSPAELSNRLEAADIFLVPHNCGLSAKRGSLMAAMQHGLPVVGTRGPMTDDFWSGVEGVKLVRKDSDDAFCRAVEALCVHAQMRLEKGRYNRDYYESHFTWQRIGEVFLREVV